MTTDAALLLDSNAVTALAVLDDEAVEAARPFAKVLLPLPTYGEVLYGIEVAPHLSRRLRPVLSLLNNLEVVPMDRETGERYAALNASLKQAGKPIPVNDMWIAAVALQHNLPLMTRDTHFERISGLTKIGW